MTEFHLIRRGRENLRLLTKQSFAVQVDAAGKKFVYQVVNELDKNHRANDQPDDSPGEGRMFESPYCTVKTFELYTSKLNPVLSCLWQRPRATDNFSRSDEVRYCNVPLGKNALGTFMSSISKELKLSQKYTNHCIRATAVSLLRPIYTVRLCHTRQVYDRPATCLRTIYTRTTFSLTKLNMKKFAPGFTERKF